MLHIWGYILKVHELSHICVTINLSPSSAVEMSLKVDQNMYDKVLISPTMFGTKMDRFEHLRTRGTPPGGRPVGRRTARPRRRLGTLRRDVKKCLKIPSV